MSHQHMSALLMPLMLMAFGAFLWAVNKLLAKHLPSGWLKKILLMRIGR